MFTTFKRVFKLAWSDFWRNKGRSVSAIFVLVITISLVTGLFFLHGVSDYIITQVQNRIDITAYFNSGTAEADILTIQSQIQKLSPDVKSVQYVSEAEALANFTQLHKDNPVFSSALTQVGDNPFLPSLNITTTGNPALYSQIAGILEGPQFATLISSVDFSQKQATIDKVFSITSTINDVGIGLAILLVLVVVLVVFNTIKLAIDASKEEISTMTIVGATRWFVRMPFIIQGALFGAIAFMFCFIITGVLAYFFSPGFSFLTSGFSLFGYFVSNIFIIMLIQLGFGAGLGVVTSVLVVQKYLKV